LGGVLAAVLQEAFSSADSPALPANMLQGRITLLTGVVDTTQTAFLPNRWVGDDMLAHLEEIAYLEETQQPEVMVLFLDSEKPFNRLDRAWIERMLAMGFGAGLRILHAGTSARVALNGWQGSPLSALLKVLPPC
jgi:hypothetical protein